MILLLKIILKGAFVSMGLIVAAIVGVVVLIIKVSIDKKEEQESQELMAFFADCNHHWEDVITIAKWNYELILEAAICQGEFKSNKITQTEYLYTLKKILTTKNEIMKQYNVTEEEMTRYYRFVYLDKNGEHIIKKHLKHVK